jgi:hypothetical protein
MSSNTDKCKRAEVNMLNELHVLIVCFFKSTLSNFGRTIVAIKKQLIVATIQEIRK